MIEIRLDSNGVTLGGSNELKFTWEIYDRSDPLVIVTSGTEKFDAQTDQAKKLKSTGDIKGEIAASIRTKLRAILEEYKDSIGDVTP